MPYTPPSRSPATSHQASPVQSPGVRPNLPRSNSSTSYLQRHRRSPSIDHAKSPLNGHDINNTTSVRQSPPPLTDTSMPPGAILSPPDSAQNSSDDEPSSQTHRQVDGLQELQEAVRRSLDNVRHPSTWQSTSFAAKGKQNLHIELPTSRSEGSSPGAIAPPRLSASARKISHSRSATESSFFDLQSAQSMPASFGNSDESDEDTDNGGAKPPLLRKKSGELVKPAIRPQSRRKHSSMPGTPTFSKAVHFNEDIEQVRHFLQVDKPIAVSAGASPIEGYEEETEFPFGYASSHVTDWELCLKNFPRESLERMSKPVRVERLYMSTDQKSLIGVVAAANLAFHKVVVARFTLDYWKTTSEVVAEFSNDKSAKPRDDGYDQFSFSIKLSDQANLEARTLLLCVRYNVNGQDHWDNNDSMNYQVDFIKKDKPAEAARPRTADPNPAARPIPRSRHNSSASRPRSSPSFEDDFSNGFDPGVKFRHTGDTPPRRRNTPGGAQFSTRYDFGASLSAALTQAQEQLSNRGGLGANKSAANNAASSLKPAHMPAPVNSTLPPRTGVKPINQSQPETPRPDALLANRQSLDSRAYQEFVSKYCFFGSSSNKNTPGGQAQANNTPGNDGAQDETSAKTASFYAFPPRSPDDSTASSSPGLGEGHSVDTTSSHMSYSYPFTSQPHSGLITPDYHQPTAIQG